MRERIEFRLSSIVGCDGSKPSVSLGTTIESLIFCSFFELNLKS